MLENLSAQKIAAVIREASVREMLRFQRWEPEPGHTPPRIEPTWKLRRGATAESFNMTETDIETFGQKVTAVACAELGARPFQFRERVAIAELTNLKSLRLALYVALTQKES